MMTFQVINIKQKRNFHLTCGMTNNPSIYIKSQASVEDLIISLCRLSNDTVLRGHNSDYITIKRV